MVDKIIMEAKGVNGQIELLENKVRIKRKGVMGFLTQGLKGDKDILISQISSIQFKKAGGFTNGYIQFSFLGGQESKAGLLKAGQDENTVMFNVYQKKEFEAIKEAIEKRIDDIHSQATSPSSSSSLSDLEKLAELKDKGIITEEEFQAKKKQILGIKPARDDSGGWKDLI